jgi:hypothetical protein
VAKGGCGRLRPVASAWPGQHASPPAESVGRILGTWGRKIWTILGVILAIWLAFTAIGWIFAMLKTFLIIGLIAVVVVIVVSLLARRPRSG